MLPSKIGLFLFKHNNTFYHGGKYMNYYRLYFKFHNLNIILNNFLQLSIIVIIIIKKIIKKHENTKIKKLEQETRLNDNTNYFKNQINFYF